MSIQSTTEIQNTPAEAQLAALVHHELRFGRQYAFRPEPFTLISIGNHDHFRDKAQRAVAKGDRLAERRHRNFCKAIQKSK